MKKKSHCNPDGAHDWMFWSNDSERSKHPWCIFMTLELTFSFMGVLAFESKSNTLKVA
jgi:hypothetical protein